MNTQISFEAPTQVVVDRYIAQAHQLRSEYIARSVKSGLTHLRKLFSRKSSAKTVSA
jgi:hypothetical protein